MAFEPMPIMGDKHSTEAVTLANHTTVFVQGDTKLIKLQRFDLPAGAKQIRAQSRQTVGATGDIATVWTWLERDDGSFEQVTRSFSQEAWQIDPRIQYENFYVIALYDTGLFSQPGEFSGAEIDDLAGLIREVKFIVGGAIENVAFGDVFEFPGASPLKFYKHEDVTLISDPYDITRNAFQRSLENARQHARMPGMERINEVILVWDDFIARNRGTWTGFEMKDVRYNFIVRLDGMRTTGRSATETISHGQ
jgi:hypothetical protein